MKRHRAIHFAMNELMDEWRSRLAYLFRRAMRDNFTIRQKIDMINDLQRFLHIVRYQD